MFRPFRALAVFALNAVLAGGIAFAQTPPSVFSPGPFVDRGAEKSRANQEEDRKKWSSCKNKLEHKKLNWKLE